MEYVYIQDSYGNYMSFPGHTGPSTSSDGQLFAVIEGQTTKRYVDGDRFGRFNVISDGTVLFESRTYFGAIDYCNSIGLVYTDCTR